MDFDQLRGRLRRSVSVATISLLLVTVGIGVVAIGPGISVTPNEPTQMSAQTADDGTQNQTVAVFPDTARVLEADIRIPYVIGNDDMAMELDSEGQPHIAYFENGKNLTYAWLDGTRWRTQSVPTPVESNNLFDLSMALDDSDDPHLVFKGGGATSPLVYVHRSDGSWTVETIKENIAGDRHGIAIDSDGDPNVVFLGYRDHTFGTPTTIFTLQYATKSDGSWQIRNISSRRNQAVSRLALELGNQDQPHIVAEISNQYGNKLEYLTKERGTWNWTTVEKVDVDDRFESFSLAVAEDGQPHLLYGILRQYETNQVRYATVNGERWTKTTFDRHKEGRVGTETDIEIDTQGRIHGIYDRGHGNGDRDLWYAFAANGSWSRKPLHLPTHRPNARLDLDERGNPHIVYHTGNTGTPNPGFLKHLEGRVQTIRSRIQMPHFTVDNTQPARLGPGGAARGVLKIRNVGTRDGVGLVLLAYPESVNVSVPDASSDRVLVNEPGLTVLTVRGDIFETVYQPYRIHLPREEVLGDNASYEIGTGISIHEEVVASVRPQQWQQLQNRTDEPMGRLVLAKRTMKKRAGAKAEELASLSEDKLRDVLTRLAKTNPEFAGVIRDAVCQTKQQRGDALPDICSKGPLGGIQQ